MKVTNKKALRHPKPDPENRLAFCQALATYEEVGKPILSLDESDFAHDMPKPHRYALRVKGVTASRFGVKKVLPILLRRFFEGGRAPHSGLVFYHHQCPDF